MKYLLVTVILAVLLFGCCSTIPFTTQYPTEWRGNAGGQK